MKSPLYDSQEKETIIGTIGIFWDITERKQTQIELAEERNLLRTLIDNLPDHIYVKDRERKISWQTELFHDANGVETWSMTNKLPLRNIDGDIIGLVGMGHVITEKKLAEEERKLLETQLQQAQKMETVGTLTAGIAHDFNNLLHVINGYASLLKLDIDENSPQYMTLEKILRAGKSAADLISQLMTFSRKNISRPQVLELNGLLLNIEKMLVAINLLLYAALKTDLKCDIAFRFIKYDQYVIIFYTAYCIW